MATTSTILLGAGLALAAGSSLYQASAANSAAKAQNSALQQNALVANAELTRQQEEVNKIAAEKKGDRARVADQESAQLRALMAEKGGLQTGNYDALVASIGYYEGMDFGRIDRNAANEISSLQTQKQKVSNGVQIQMDANSREALNMKIGAGLQLTSTAIKTGYAEYSRRESEERWLEQQQANRPTR
jgi:hypothetical protein